MSRLSIVSDTLFRAKDIASHLPDVFETRLFSLDDLSEGGPVEFTISDVNLDCAHIPDIPDLKKWLSRRPKNAKIIFVVDKGSRYQAVQANAIGATDLVSRPLEGRMLLTKLLGDIESLADDPLAAGNSGVATGIRALQDIFNAATLGGLLDPVSINKAGECIASQIAEEGSDAG